MINEGKIWVNRKRWCSEGNFFKIIRGKNERGDKN